MVVVVGILAACLAGYWFLAVRPFGEAGGLARCESTLLEEVPSPDGRWVAATYEVGCGATTGSTMQVNLRPAGQPLNPTPDGLVLTGRILFVEGKVPVTAVWAFANTLEVRVPREALQRIGTPPDSWGEVKIRLAPTQG